MFDEWVVLFPIEYLDIESGSLTIADVEFYLLTDVRMAKWVCFKKLEEAGLKKFCDKFFKDLICAEVKVDAADMKVAYEKASLKVRCVLDVLRIFKGRCELQGPLGAIIKNKRTGREEFSFFNAKWTQKSAWPWKCKIKRGDQPQLSKSTELLEPFLRRPESCELNRKIVRALRWSADATQEKDEVDKILKCIIALECILLKGRGKKANHLAERVALTYASTNTNRDKIFLDIKRLYKLRNCIVHGEKYQITKDDLSTLDWISRKLVFVIADVAKSNSFTEAQHVIDFLGRRKGDWRPPNITYRPC